MMKSGTFVLVHGAFHGGWCWQRLIPILAGHGYSVFAPTLTGLGEKHHLNAPSVTLSTWTDDVSNLLDWEELDDVTLVGHSFSGAVIAGVAERQSARLRNLVFLDAMLVEGDEKPFDTLADDVVEARRAAAAAGGRNALPVPPAESFGVFEAADRGWLERRLTPHPISTYESVLELSDPIGNGLRCAYVTCTDPYYAPLSGSRERAATYHAWRHLEIAAGHDCMVTAPDALADLLVEDRER